MPIVVMMNTFHPAEEVILYFRKNSILMERRFPPMETYLHVSLGLLQQIPAFSRAWDLLPHAENVMQH